MQWYKLTAKKREAGNGKQEARSRRQEAGN
jgi:hypothetical protein